MSRNMIGYESFHNLDELNEWKKHHKVEIINIESIDNYYFWIRVWYKY